MVRKHASIMKIKCFFYLRKNWNFTFFVRLPYSLLVQISFCMNHLGCDPLTRLFNQHEIELAHCASYTGVWIWSTILNSVMSIFIRILSDTFPVLQIVTFLLIFLLLNAMVSSVKCKEFSRVATLKKKSSKFIRETLVSWVSFFL